MVQLCQFYALVALFAGAASGAFAGRSHNDLAMRSSGHVELHRRFRGLKISFYDVEESGNQVSCGGHHKNWEDIVALDSGMMKPSYCNKEIIITARGKTKRARIVDSCPGCGPLGIDLTPSLFSFFLSQSIGVFFDGEWQFADEVPAAPKPTPKPVVVKTTPRPTPKTTPAPVKTTSKKVTAAAATTQATTTESKDADTTTARALSTDTASAPAAPSAVDLSVGPAAGVLNKLDDSEVDSTSNLYLVNLAVVKLAAIVLSSKSA